MDDQRGRAGAGAARVAVIFFASDEESRENPKKKTREVIGKRRNFLLGIEYFVLRRPLGAIMPDKFFNNSKNPSLI